VDGREKRGGRGRKEGRSRRSIEDSQSYRADLYFTILSGRTKQGRKEEGEKDESGKATASYAASSRNGFAIFRRRFTPLPGGEKRGGKKGEGKKGGKTKEVFMKLLVCPVWSSPPISRTLIRLQRAGTTPSGRKSKKKRGGKRGGKKKRTLRTSRAGHLLQSRLFVICQTSKGKKGRGEKKGPRGKSK